MAAGTAAPSAQLPFAAPTRVREAFATLGRTEDLRFSPSGRRLALACFRAGRIAVVEIEITASASGPSVAVARVDEIASPALRGPHGLDFLDEETLVVANRDGGLAVLRLPAGGSAEPVDAVVQDTAVGPGSVVVDSRDPSHPWVLACNNWASTITRHAVGPGLTFGAEELIARKWLDLPDGVALSHNGRWLAISNHNSHSILVLAYPTAGEDADPVAILRGALYPHGLRFTADDRYLLVADAGGPYVHAFASPPDGWQSVRYPDAAIRMMDDETFRRGRYNSREGGPKGIDLHPGTSVLAVTAECLPLAFFDLGAALETPAAPSAEALLEYELGVMAETEALKVSAAEDRAQLDATRLKVELLRDSLDRRIAGSAGRRLAAPLRTVAGRLRR